MSDQVGNPEDRFSTEAHIMYAANTVGADQTALMGKLIG